METVNVQCGECEQIIGVSREDLGHHVQCPLCNKIVQAPATAPEPSQPEPASEPEAEDFPEIPGIAPSSESDAESIFSDDEDMSDDLFGTAPAPQVLMPDEPPAEEPPAEEPAPAESAPVNEPLEPPGYGSAEEQPQEYPAQEDAWQDHTSPVASDEHELPAPTVRRSKQPSMVGPLVLIFLVPYAIITTCIILWFVASGRLALPKSKPKEETAPAEKGQFQFMPDNDPQGKPEKVDTGAALPQKLRIGIGQPIQLGQVKVTPLKVTRAVDEQGRESLYLHMRIKNTSKDVRMNPIPMSFVSTKAGPTPEKMYTYLQVTNQNRSGGSDTKPPMKCYVDLLEWWVPNGDKQSMSKDGILPPGGEMLAVLRTRMQDHRKFDQMRLMKQPLMWRVKVRRGLEKVGDRELALASVIGVQFQFRQLKPEDTSRYVLQ